MSPSEQLEYLFSYGSLQDESVQLATFGRTLSGNADMLPGYRTFRIEIQDRTAAAANGADFYMNAEFTGRQSDSVTGMRFSVTKHELEHADVYEAGANYERILVTLKSGSQSWVYVSAAPLDDAG